MRHFELTQCQRCDGVTRYRHESWTCQNCLWFGLDEKPMLFKTVIRLRGDEAVDVLEMMAGGNITGAKEYLLASTDTYECITDTAPWQTGCHVERLEDGMYLFASYNFRLVGITQASVNPEYPTPTEET